MIKNDGKFTSLHESWWESIRLPIDFFIITSFVINYNKTIKTHYYSYYNFIINIIIIIILLSSFLDKTTELKSPNYMPNEQVEFHLIIIILLFHFYYYHYYFIISIVINVIAGHIAMSCIDVRNLRNQILCG